MSEANSPAAQAARRRTFAIISHPDAGAHAGKIFLIVDANGIAGYQAREDFVFCLENASNLAGLAPGDFI